MAGARVTVDIPDLQSSNAALLDPIKEVRKALDDFYRKVNGLRPAPWGKGEIGEQFETEYKGLKNPVGPSGKRGYEATLQALEDLVIGMQNMRDKMKVMADNYQAVEDANQR